MPARQPRVLVNDRGHQVGNLGIGALPQRAESAGAGDDRQVVHIEPLGDFGQLVRHARPAGHAGHQSLGALQHVLENLLRAAHFPQYVDVDGALAIGDVIGAAHLLHSAIDGKADQFLVAPLPREGLIALGHDFTFGVVGVGIDGGNRADTARGSPCARAGVIGRSHALATLNQRPHFATAVKNRLQPLESHTIVSFVRIALSRGRLRRLRCWHRVLPSRVRVARQSPRTVRNSRRPLI